jgi:membrane peptidoglycan carboxypeptidase
VSDDSGRPHPVPSHDDEGEDGFFARKWHRHQQRRQAKKARLAAMTRGRRWARRGLVAGTWFLGLIAALMVVTIVLFYTLTDVPRPEQLPLPQVATIEYSDGSTLAKIGSVDRTIVRLEQVPAAVRWAVLAAEDRGFYSEPGVSVRGTIRAALSDVTGGNTQGGSGITQQYVKNAYLSASQTLSRKLKELMIAVKLSREYSKDQILEFYLNTVYFGRNVYGIQAAAQAYFGVNVEKLTTAQGALLAGVLRAPGYYDPAANKAAAVERWHYVLDGMVKTKHLSAAEAATMPFPATKPPKGTGLGTTGWRYLLVNAVLADLEAHGIPTSEVYAKGLVIRTTIDKKAQVAAVEAIRQTFTGLTAKQRNLKNALVAINPKDGGVLAYYGGSGPGVKGYDGQVDYNDYATRGARPPGSSFKPYTLATALTQTLKQTEGKPHYAIDSRVDGRYCVDVEGTQICNDPGDKNVSGPRVKVADAMKYSLNTTFDLMASQAGPSDVAATAHAMGISKTDPQGNKTLQNSDGSTSFGIGIGDYAVAPLDQANGYATLANQGIRNDAYLVSKATSSDGEIVYQHKANPSQAVDPKVANDVTLTMEPIAQYSGDGLADGRKSAAKTGTEGIGGKTTDNSDAWMVGFTKQVSAAVWVGTGLSKPIYDASGNPLYGSQLPGRTWKLFMDTYLNGTVRLGLPTKQLISANGTVPIPTPTASPTPSTSPTPSSSTPKPTFSITTTFPAPSSTPVTSLPTPTPTPSPPSTTPTGCGGLLGSPCPSTSAAGGAPPGGAAASSSP